MKIEKQSEDTLTCLRDFSPREASIGKKNFCNFGDKIPIHANLKPHQDRQWNYFSYVGMNTAHLYILNY